MIGGMVMRLRRFASDTDGAALVEFGLVLPVMLLLFSVTIEGARLMWSYQAAIAGVRDATRYVGRVVPGDICGTSPATAAQASIMAMQGTVTDIVRNSADGLPLFPASITVDDVTPVVVCKAGAYHLSYTPVATVTADMTITWPFSGIFGLFGGVPPVTHLQVADTGRIFGT